MVDSKTCILCQACISICPVAAIKLIDGKIVIDEKLCIKCKACEGFCPVNAIKIK